MANKPVTLGHSGSAVFREDLSEIEERFAYVGSTSNVEFKGSARVGKNNSQACWQIRKFYYDASNNVTRISFPLDTNGRPSSKHIFKWEDLDSLTFAPE